MRNQVNAKNLAMAEIRARGAAAAKLHDGDAKGVFARRATRRRSLTQTALCEAGQPWDATCTPCADSRPLNHGARHGICVPTSHPKPRPPSATGDSKQATSGSATSPKLSGTIHALVIFLELVAKRTAQRGSQAKLRARATRMASATEPEANGRAPETTSQA